MVIGEGERRRRRRRRRKGEREIVQWGPYIIRRRRRRRRLLEFGVWYRIEPNVYRNAIDLESNLWNLRRGTIIEIDLDSGTGWRIGGEAASVCRRGWRVDWGRCMLGFDLNLIPSNLCCDFSSPFKREREYACVAFLFSWRTIKRILAIRWIEYINSSNLIKRLQTWAFNTRVLKFIQKTFYLSNPLIVPRINFERDYYITCIHHLQPHQTQFEQDPLKKSFCQPII